jgi:hypothetical protein
MRTVDSGSNLRLTARGLHDLCEANAHRMILRDVMGHLDEATQDLIGYADLMAKRGETRPWRIKYEWLGGLGGTETRSTLEEARSFADTLCDNSDRRHTHITITVQHRDEPEPRIHFTHTPLED